MDLLGRMAEFGIIGFIAHYALKSIFQTQSGEGECFVDWDGEWDGGGGMGGGRMGGVGMGG